MGVPSHVVGQTDEPMLASHLPHNDEIDLARILLRTPARHLCLETEVSHQKSMTLGAIECDRQWMDHG